MVRDLLWFEVIFFYKSTSNFYGTSEKSTMKNTSIQAPEWLTNGLNHIWLPYTQMHTAPAPVAVSHIDGATIHLADGRQLTDGVASWWTAIHGYNPPELQAALQAQLKTMPHVMLGGLGHEPAYRLAGRLATLAPGDLNRSFFTESGSVAVEVAMKIAIQYWRNLDGTQRTKFVAFDGGYHGDTFHTMSVCDPEEGMHAFFADALAPQYMIPVPDTAARVAALDALLAEKNDIAAIIIEPRIQGAGGMRMHGPDILKTLRHLADRHNVLLIFDEIFTGFGRTGEMFAADTAAVVPDIMVIGKALTGGITPLAATIVSDTVYAPFDAVEADKALMHGPTFTGHALACAVALASLDLFEQTDRLGQVHHLQTLMQNALAGLNDDARVAEVRVLGAVAAVETAADFDIEAARAWFIDQGVFIRPLGRVIYLTPAYTIRDSEVERLTDAIADFIATR